QLAAANAAHNASLADLDAAIRDRDGAAAARDEAATALTAAASARDDAASALASALQNLATLTAEGERLERALAAQERIIAYRQSARWWVALPWVRIRLWWQRVAGK
ncbi:MAG: hypothetical protein ABI624_22025, partial [Casimicrobiaceae bacterium]